MTDSPAARRTPAPRSTDRRIGEALARLESAVDRKPGFGHSTCRSVTESATDLACRTVEGDHRIDTDLSRALGGSGLAPSPSVLLRAALGSCVAMSYRLRAARNGVELGPIRVTVETDSILAGMLLPDAPAPAGFVGLRYHVDIETQASFGQVERLAAEVDRLSPVLDALSANPLSASLSINEGSR